MNNNNHEQKLKKLLENMGFLNVRVLQLNHNIHKNYVYNSSDFFVRVEGRSRSAEIRIIYDPKISKNLEKIYKYSINFVLSDDYFDDCEYEFMADNIDEMLKILDKWRLYKI